MCVRIYLALLIPLIGVNGCRPPERAFSWPQTSPPSPAYYPESVTDLLTIEDCDLTDAALVLKYRVANTFPHDIWICATQGFFDGEDSLVSQDVRITDGMLWIQRRANVQQNCLITGQAFAGYRRLSPGQARSYTIVLPRPIQSFSVFYATHEEFSEVVLNRIVLQVGYFEGDLLSLIRKYSLQSEQNPRGALTFSLNWHKSDPSVILVPYLYNDKWDGLTFEKSISAIIPDVAIPAELGARAVTTEAH